MNKFVTDLYNKKSETGGDDSGMEKDTFATNAQTKL